MASTKRVLFLRHGQAVHNPRAEAEREAGCDRARFLELIGEDDALDAPLTELGEDQARSVQARHGRRLRSVGLVVSSPLSRAIRTADLALPPFPSPGGGDPDEGRPDRICVEDFREINGRFLNARRRDLSELEGAFRSSQWDFSHISNFDESWTESLEDESECAERGYRGLIWLAQRKEDDILVVSHGGILRFTMNQHPNIRMEEGRKCSGKEKRDVGARFGNCELREYLLSWSENCDSVQVSPDDCQDKNIANANEIKPLNGLEDDSYMLRPLFTLTEVSLE
uniref:Phosphoglycerate mutase n=1 Tax=Trieres chinensis TaxID=1514140 RepID=A0A7S2EFN8_TRICV